MVDERLAITNPQRNGEYQKGKIALDHALATDIESNGFKMKTCKYFTDGYKAGAYFVAVGEISYYRFITDSFGTFSLVNDAV